MPQSHRNNRVLIIILILILLVFIVLYFRCCTTKTHQYGVIEKKDGKISWNILFKPGTNEASRNQTIQEIKDYVQAAYAEYNRNNGTNIRPDSFAVDYCPCDSLLYNVGFGAINAEGESVTTVPSSSKLRPSGDNVTYAVSENAETKEPARSGEFKRDSIIYLSFKTIDTSRRLAIIDSGIDSTLFNQALGEIIWNDPAGPTLKNFLPGNISNSYLDATKNKHGSAVAAIALKAMGNTGVLPKIMILKALSDSSVGTVFSVSCALSYARQKNATLINLSLGYYGAADSILHHYLKLCDSISPAIEVFAAAGNTEGVHLDTSICTVADNHNQLAFGRLFYPACFSVDLNHFTTVTQINNGSDPCFYQNYSDKYVSLGILDKNYCCAFYVGFAKANLTYYEGSSFVTPAASGLRMATMMRGSDETSRNDLWNNMIRTINPPGRATIAGKYIPYSGR